MKDDTPPFTTRSYLQIIGYYYKGFKLLLLLQSSLISFDLLKNQNQGHDRTTSVVCTLFQGFRQIWGQGTQQKLKFLSFTKPQCNLATQVQVV